MAVGLTVAEMKDKIFEGVGEDANYDPDDATPSADLLRLLNEAQRRIVSWKDSRGNRAHFDSLWSELYFQSSILEGTISAPSTTQVTLSSGGAHDDRYNGWLIEVDGVAARLIVDYTSAGVATVSDAWSSAPTTGGDFTAYHNRYLLLPSSHNWAADHITLPAVPTLDGTSDDIHRSEGNLLEILRVIDVDLGRPLDRASRTADFDTEWNTKGDPDAWIRQGNALVFDRAPDEAKYFKMEYYRHPTAMVADSEEPEIGPEWCWPMVLWCRWQIRVMQEEVEMAFAAKMDFQDDMSRRFGSSEMANIRDWGRFTLRSPY